jgi:hypothetical protein
MLQAAVYGLAAWTVSLACTALAEAAERGA